jgi:hypothetical protein
MFRPPTNSRSPPAVAINCSTVIGTFNGYMPGFSTLPVMNARRL